MFENAIATIIGVLVGYLLNYFNNISAQNKIQLKLFRNNLIKYLELEISYESLLLSYMNLPKNKKIHYREIINFKKYTPEETEKAINNIIQENNSG